MMHRQLFRYIVVGLLLNALLYAVYLLLTRTLLGSTAAMTLTYCLGVLTGFVLNRAVTFRHAGRCAGALSRYVASYIFGYALNLLTLWLLVAKVGIAHEAVQGAMILILPGLLFMLQKYWVFSSGSGAGVALRPAA